MLGPVEFYAARDPWTGKPDECRLDDMVVVDEMTLLDFIVGHLYPAAKFGEHHHFDVFVFDENVGEIFDVKVAETLIGASDFR